MIRLTRLVIALLLALSVATPALAKMAAIQTAVPLEDQSQSGIQAAAEQAVNTAVRGAVAMGLPKVKLHQAVVVNKMVVIQILATDEASDAEGEQRDEGKGDSTPGLAPDKTSVFGPGDQL